METGSELVAAAFAGDREWRDRLHIITEPEAAAVHCAHLTNLHQLRPSQNFMICDAGGGTVVRSHLFIWNRYEYGSEDLISTPRS